MAWLIRDLLLRWDWWVFILPPDFLYSGADLRRSHDASHPIHVVSDK
jgi:hypothetical protein